MKNQFVPYELAVKLKELGFDEECLGYYIVGRLWIPNKHDYNSYKLNSNLPNKNSSLKNIPKIVFAPLWQQVFDWFWDKYEMWGEYFPWNPQINNWKIAIFYKVNGEYNDSEYFINGNLNEARQACLEKLLEFK